jgi:hypothetical protein
MTDDTRALVPIEERTVDFYGDEIKGAIITMAPSDRAVYVPVKPLCDFLGIVWESQRQRIQRDPVLVEEVRAVLIDTPGGPQEMTCLPLDMLNGWLFGINASRVKEEMRERVIRYQRECYRVLAEAFQQPEPPDPLAQVEQLGHALITLAREQREFNRQLGETQRDLGDVKARVISLEERIRPGEPVTEEQAQHISQAVKAIAYKLSERTGRNEYGGVYSQLYGKFGITSYKLLPAARYEEAMAFLQEWWQQIAGTGDVPF